VDNDQPHHNSKMGVEAHTLHSGSDGGFCRISANFQGNECPLSGNVAALPRLMLSKTVPFPPFLYNCRSSTNNA
ncbi:MAG: hypothetical protein ACOYLK_17640, partial [Sphingomonas sp.]